MPLQFEPDDVVRTLRKADNVNSAIKSFLKKQQNHNDPSIRFSKDLRDLLLGRDHERAVAFVTKNMERFYPALLAIGAYAHASEIDAIANSIVEKFADSFNATYQLKGENLEYVDEDKFKSIVDESVTVIEKQLADKDFKGSDYMRAIVMNAIFEQPVLREITAS